MQTNGHAEGTYYWDTRPSEEGGQSLWLFQDGKWVEVSLVAILEELAQVFTKQTPSGGLTYHPYIDTELQERVIRTVAQIKALA